MSGERKRTYPKSIYGDLTMRAFDIDGNDISAFYDAGDDLIFVLDNTINQQKPNILLVINPDGDKKWDEILSTDYNVDLETIRPKVDNKYQKLDIEYSGLGVYEGLINAFNADEDLAEHLNQLAILRDSAARHSAMMRLNAANETISKTNATIVKTKESIAKLEARVKTLRSKLAATKKQIGRVSTKQSAAKILKLESQIEATNEKLKRAKKRLESAQRRLEAATVDAELASDLLNQPSTEIKQKTSSKSKNKPMVVARNYPVQTMADDDDKDDDDFVEEYDEDTDEELPVSDVKPLFEQDPQILNNDIAFKPISFEPPVFEEPVQTIQNSTPDVDAETRSGSVLESMTPIGEPKPVFVPEPVATEESTIESFEPIANVPEFIPEPVDVEKPVLETMTPVVQAEQAVVDEPVVEPAQPAVPIAPVQPAAPVMNNFQTPLESAPERSRPGFVYYMLLVILILLSIFTLWLYRKNMATDTIPALVADTTETRLVKTEKKAKAEPVVSVNTESESVFLDDGEPTQAEPVMENKAEETIAPEPQSNEYDAEDEGEDEENITIESAPVVIDAVPRRLNTSGANADEETSSLTEDDILTNKPVYEPGAKHDEMFVNESDYVVDVVAEQETTQPVGLVEDSEYEYQYENDPYYGDEEEAAYQAELMNQ